MTDASRQVRIGEGRVRRVNPVLAEGEDGQFTQSWFPIAMSSEVGASAIIGREFLDGKVVIFRDSQGRAQVLSAHCLHVGANLCIATVVEDTMRCPYHHWRYDIDGQCVATGVGNTVPPNARLFKFPTRESLGLIWAFNGVEPLYELPDYAASLDEAQLELRVIKDHRVWPVDPWIIRSNTPDWQHFKFVHGMQVDSADTDIHDRFTWSEFGLTMVTETELDQDRGSVSYQIRVDGTSTWCTTGHYNGEWHMIISALGIPRPGSSNHFVVLAVHKGDGSEAALDRLNELMDVMLDEDQLILNNINYKPGLLTEADRSLGRYLKYIRSYPRAHPSRDFIN